MTKKGKVMYVPRVVVEELRDIMVSEDLDTPGEAWHKLVKRGKPKGFEPPLMRELRDFGRPGRKKKGFVGGVL